MPGLGEQRNRYTRGTLEATWRARLKVLSGWTSDPHADSWDRRSAARQCFVARLRGARGHARVPTDHVEAGLPLASWLIRRRQDYKAGRVPADRMARLRALPGWTWDVLVARWEEHLAALVRYTERKGHARVPEPHLEDRLRLGRRLIVQQQGRRRGAIAEKRAGRLAALPGWAWDMRDVAWDDDFSALQQFQARTGHRHAPCGW